MRKLVGILLGLLLIMSTSAFAANDLSKIYRSAGNTIAGNPTGPITIVEFFDYNCPYCRMIYPSFVKMVANDSDLRVVYREYPILSPRSLLPAQAALAAQDQGKYLQMHTAMMEADSPLYLDEINHIAQGLGMNVKELDKDMNSSHVNNQIDANVAIGEALNIRGVPSFIVARTSPPSDKRAKVLVGPSLSRLKQAIASAKE